MIKYIVVFVLSTVIAMADVHFAKLEPYNTINIKSEVNGRVVLAREDLEGKIANSLIVKIDDKLDKIDLKNSKLSLQLLSKMITLNKGMLDNLKKNVAKKYSLYKKLAPLASSSVSQKDSLFSAYVSAKSQYNATQEKVLNLENQKVTLSQKIALLEDRLSKKSIYIKNKYIYALNVKKGEFVTVGMPIATISDISKAKLTLYLSKDELSNLDSKKIYINGNKTNLKFSKIWKIADKKYISSYRAEIILKPIDRFSTLIKVEVK